MLLRPISLESSVSFIIKSGDQKLTWLLFFSDQWNQTSHPMTKDAFGSFTIVLPSNGGQPAIPHNSKVKVCTMLLFHDSFPEANGS